MDVLIICNSASGLEVFRGMLIQELIKKENAVCAIIPLADNEKEGVSEKRIEEMGCHLIRVPMERRGLNPFRDCKLLLTYTRMVRKWKPGLVVTYTIKPNIYGGIACRLCHASYAANITGLGTAFQNDGLLRKFVTFLYKAALRKAKTVFFENVEDRQVFLNAGIIREERGCLLNGAGVNLEHFYPEDYPAGKKTRFLFIGRIMKEKGVDELFDAMKRLTAEGVDCLLDILGGFDEDYSGKIQEYESEGWLKYWGYQEDVRPFIAASHCFVLPSWHEGMANTNLECAASGRPVITSRICGCMEAVEDGVTGFLCERKDSDSLYAAMKRFCALPMEERKAMGLAGRKRMEAIFDKKQVVRETIARLME